MIQFDETLVYDGIGAQRNNVLNDLGLIQEDLYEDLEPLKAAKDTTEVEGIIDSAYKDYRSLLAGYAQSISELSKTLNKEIGFIEEYKEDEKKRFRKSERLKRLIGTDLSDFAGVDLNGRWHKLEEFKGRITVLDFWATWCGPCKAEMPNLKELEEKYGDNVNFVSISVNDKVDKWKETAPTFGLRNNIYVPEEKQSQLDKLEISSIPRYIVLDKNLKIIDPKAPRPSSGELEEYFQ